MVVNASFHSLKYIISCNIWSEPSIGLNLNHRLSRNKIQNTISTERSESIYLSNVDVFSANEKQHNDIDFVKKKKTS